MILTPGSSIAQPTGSDSVLNSFQSPKRADAPAAHNSVSYTPVYSSDEEDDSRDRQSHWKRIKTRSDDNPPNSNGRNLIRWTERDRHSNNTSYEASSPVRRPLQTLRTFPSPKKSVNPPRPGHRMIVLKSRLHDSDVSRHPAGHDSRGLDVAMGRFKDGGTASKDIMDAAGASKRKFEPEARRGMISMNIDMYERGMVVREQHMARRLPEERATPEGRYQVRVSGREEGEFYGDDDAGASLFIEDSHPVEERPRMTVDLREALNRRTRGVADTVNRENRGYGDQPNSHRTTEPGFDVKVRVRRVDFDLSFSSGKPSLGATAAGPPPERSEVRKKILPPSDHEGKSFSSLRIGNPSAAAVGSKGERETEAERRRERWAEKERDLERDLQKELQKQQQTMAKAQQPSKSVTVVDYSHKFTVAKAPLGVPVKPVESDPHRLCQRQKQIDYGKNTLGYERYIELVPRYQRTKAHPRTPDIRQVCSKRSWDGQIRKWRRLLHEYDPPKEDDDEDPDQMFVPTREHDGIRGSSADDCMMDVQSELVEDADLKIYDGWSDEEC